MVKFSWMALLATMLPQMAIAASDLGSRSSCDAYTGIPAGWPKVRHAGMVRIPGGEFIPGSDAGYADERPAGKVRVKSLWLDRTEVTNAQFAVFVAASGYRTEAEIAGGAAVFRAPTEFELGQWPYAWWQFVKGADWRHPEGPDSNLDGRANQPVVQVTLQDALAYARWLGHRLPTEAEWEYAAKAGRSDPAQDKAPVDADGKPLANFWQGNFPGLNTAEDGFIGRAPVGCYPANGLGLFDSIANVWEWTSDFYRGGHQGHGSGDPLIALRAAGKSLSPSLPRVIKGGSFLCAANFCVRYRAAARHPQEANLPTSHVGFRTVSER